MSAIASAISSVLIAIIVVFGICVVVGSCLLAYLIYEGDIEAADVTEWIVAWRDKEKKPKKKKEDW